MLSTVNLVKSFDGARKVLNDVTLSIEDGSLTAIMGPSGSGKSTLLYCLSGMLRPTSGQVLIEDVNISRMPQSKLDVLRRTTFGFIFQAYNLIDALTAIQNIQLPSLFGGQSVSTAQAEYALAQVGLKGLGDRYPSELSGGQCQRVAIARALAAHRSIIFADEPTGALDSKSRGEVLEQLSKLSEAGTTVLMVTHDPAVAACASRVLFLYDGAIVKDLVGVGYRKISETLADLEVSK